MSPAADTRAALDAILERLVADGWPGAILAVDCPRLDLDYAAARGQFAVGGRALGPDDGFRAAGVSKAVTAATVVRLAADGRWELDDPVAPLLPPELADRLARLEGLRGIEGLTLRRLLGHSSGLPDYYSQPPFQARVEAEPQRQWQPRELVGVALEQGRVEFAPGTEFRYGDTGYVLVGLAIERLLGCRLGEAYRTHVLEPLHMSSTWLEHHEPPRGGELSHHYRGREDLAAHNTSYEWGGGGLVTTAGDLVRFMRGLIRGALFGSRWLRELTDWRERLSWRPDSSARYQRYGLGLGTIVVGGEEVVGATGTWGGFVHHWAAGDSVIAGTANLVGADRSRLLAEVLGVLAPARH